MYVFEKTGLFCQITNLFYMSLNFIITLRYAMFNFYSEDGAV